MNITYVIVGSILVFLFTYLLIRKVNSLLKDKEFDIVTVVSDFLSGTIGFYFVMLLISSMIIYAGLTG